MNCFTLYLIVLNLIQILFFFSFLHFYRFESFNPSGCLVSERYEALEHCSKNSLPVYLCCNCSRFLCSSYRLFYYSEPFSPLEVRSSVRERIYILLLHHCFNKCLYRGFIVLSLPPICSYNFFPGAAPLRRLQRYDVNHIYFKFL